MLRLVAATVGFMLAGAAEAGDLVDEADREFVATVSQRCLLSARLGGAASNKASSDAVKAEGVATARQEAQLCTTLKQVADKWQIGTPGTLERPSSQDFDRIVGLSGAAFDAEYRAAQAHIADTMAGAAADEMRSGSNPDLKAFATGPLAEAVIALASAK